MRRRITCCVPPEVLKKITEGEREEKESLGSKTSMKRGDASAGAGGRGGRVINSFTLCERGELV